MGKVAAVRGDRVAVELTAALRRGDGIAFPSILGEDHDQGGRVYEIFVAGKSLKEVAGGQVELAFARDGLDLAASASRPGDLEDRRSAARPPPEQDLQRRADSPPRAIGPCRWRPPWAAAWVLSPRPRRARRAGWNRSSAGGSPLAIR